MGGGAHQTQAALSSSLIAASLRGAETGGIYLWLTSLPSSRHRGLAAPPGDPDMYFYRPSHAGILLQRNLQCSFFGFFSIL